MKLYLVNFPNGNPGITLGDNPKKEYSEKEKIVVDRASMLYALKNGGKLICEVQATYENLKTVFENLMEEEKKNDKKKNDKK